MKLLIGCEESATVRDAFRRRGVDAWSCDLVPTRGDPAHHYQQDIFKVLEWGCWDALIAFPPCTHLAVSGARWFKDKRWEQAAAVNFVERLMRFPRHVIENPVGVLSTRIRKPDQIIQPWMFGHGESKATCLWLRKFPPLEWTNPVAGQVARVHRMAPSANRPRDRATTYTGIAEAMAQQWSEI